MGASKKVTTLLLDQAGAYENILNQWPLFKIRTLRLGRFASWIQSFLIESTTRIKLPDLFSAEFPTSTGIPNGSFFAPIIFLYSKSP
jgi:hypothetical protein